MSELIGCWRGNTPAIVATFGRAARPLRCPPAVMRVLSTSTAVGSVLNQPTPPGLVTLQMDSSLSGAGQST